MNTVLFVCTANRCRSPVAEALLKRQLAAQQPHSAPVQMRPWAATPSAALAAERTRDDGWLVRSAGTWAYTGLSAHPHTLIAANTVGLDLQHHRSCGVDDIRPLSFFRLILTMERGHKESLCVEFPEIADRVHLLSELTGHQYDIPDPSGRSLYRHRHMIQQIDELLAEGLPQLMQLATACSE
ncbi:MAG: hypothetical protein R2911_27445 [Caldilineaceae bacterium]